MTKAEELLPVKQVDRQTLVALFEQLGIMDEISLAEIAEGLSDCCKETQIIARHRHDSQAELVACLRIVLEGDPNGCFAFAIAGNPNAADRFLERLRSLLARVGADAP